MGFNNNWVLSHKLASLVHTVSIYLLPFFNFISKYISRLQKCCNSGSLQKNDNEDIIFLEKSAPQSKAEKDKSEIRDNFDIYSEEKEKKSELHLKFKFPSFEEFSRIHKEKITSFLFNSELVPYVSTSKYEFSSGKNSTNAVIEKIATFPVKEINGKVIVGFDGGQNGKITEDGEFFDEFQCCSKENSGNFLSDGDFGDIDGENEKIELESGFLGFEENHDKFEKIELESDEFSGFKENQESPKYFSGCEGGKFIRGNNNPDKLNLDFLSENDFNGNFENENDDNSENFKLEPKIENKLESLWEHQELIDQLKMELRKVRATGLPTILEESESPKIIENLKLWEIEEKFELEDHIGELHKLYQSYTQMMRKFDILNYQKMYAMGFLQLKDPFQSKSQQKPSPPTVKSLVLQNLWLFKHKSHGSDPIKKFVNELQGDLEVVYVGQMCLSWEFLHWQYNKALDLWNSDPSGDHRYNEVAGEFQQFQVLVGRFVEDEPFQGPRVQNYVKSRCVLRNLLQVPLIREDYLKNKNKTRIKDRDEYGVTSEMLVEMVEESIQIFWRFVRSDKDYCNSITINGHKKLPELNNPHEDLKLLLEVRKILQKKEKKLKDILRSENCILRKFRHNRENDWDQVLHFFAQVDMKLVSRVFNMSKITRDQLIWCRNKLNRINFVNRKIDVELGFLLFPCN